MTKSRDLGDGEIVASTGLFLVGGRVKEVITSAEAPLVRDYLGSLLQVKNLVALLGSGASFHLGSPQTRNLPNARVLELITMAGNTPTEADGALLATINPTSSLRSSLDRPGFTPPSTSARSIQRRRQDSETPRSLAIFAIGCSRRRASSTARARNSDGCAAGMRAPSQTTGIA